MTSYLRGNVDVSLTESNYADELMDKVWQHSLDDPSRLAFVRYFIYKKCQFIV
jgi:hypothetical protein